MKPKLSKIQNICLILEIILFTFLFFVIINKYYINFKQKDFKEIKTNDDIIRHLDILNFDVNKNNINLVKKIFKKGIVFNKLSDEEILYLTLDTYDILSDDCKINVSDLNNKINTLFKLDHKINIDEVIDYKIIANNYNITIKDSNLYISKSKINDDCNLTIKKKVVNTMESKDYVVVNFYIAFGYRDNENNLINYYKDLDKNEYIESFALIDKDKLSWEKYKIYKLKLKKYNNKYQLIDLIS